MGSFPLSASACAAFTNECNYISRDVALLRIWPPASGQGALAAAPFSDGSFVYLASQENANAEVTFGDAPWANDEACSLDWITEW